MRIGFITIFTGFVCILIAWHYGIVATEAVAKQQAYLFGAVLMITGFASCKLEEAQEEINELKMRLNE